MGELTYAFYLIHVTLILGMYAAFSDQWWVSYLYSPGRFTAREGIAFVLSVYVICLALAAALYAGVERPMMRRWSRPRPAHPDPSSVESARSRAG